MLRNRHIRAISVAIKEVTENYNASKNNFHEQEIIRLRRAVATRLRHNVLQLYRLVQPFLC